MKKAVIFLMTIFLAGCDFGLKNEVDELKAKTIEQYESTKKAVEDIKSDVIEAKESVEKKIDDINKAVDEINEAKDAVDKALGSEEEGTNN